MYEYSILEQIVSFENSSFEKNCTGIDETSDDLNNIFQNLAKQSCRFVHLNKKKVKKKKPWIDTEFKDLMKTVLNVESEVKKQPFNLQLRVNYFAHWKKLIKMAKNKKYQFTKELYEKPLNWKEIDPKQYWQVLNSLKKGDNSSKNPEIQVNFEKIIEHFESQGSCKNYNVNL